MNPIHIFNLVFNILADGTTLTDIELLRNNENYLNALGAQRIPDPTTAGDFLRRFTEADIETLQRIFNQQRLKVWRQQPHAFFEQTIIEADGTLAATDGECKQGMDIAYNGVWGYHPLIVSLADTQEPLFLVNRSGNRPSHEGAAERFDQAIELCRQAGFRQLVLRGDTDFALTAHFDRWHTAGVRFVFGLDVMPNLRKIVEKLPQRFWKPLTRPAKYTVATTPRQRPPKVKEEIVRQREFENIRGCKARKWPSSATDRRSAGRSTGWWSCGRTSRLRKASGFCSMTFVTSFTLPMIGRCRRRRWSSSPTTAAIKKT